MKQNIFDDSGFFEAYMEFRRRDDGFNEALEKPTMISLLTGLKGKRILDIGCGTGDLCRHVANHGARRVLGIDPSERMLETARSFCTKAGMHIEYLHTFVEDFDVQPETFDVVLSSLALHYVEDITEVFRKVFRWLSSNGLFVFSVEHPVFSSGLQKWVRNSQGSEYWAVADYFVEGKREVEWLGKHVVKYHRTIETLINDLINCHFQIKRVVEPRPDDQLLQQHPELVTARNRPEFLFVKAGRGAGRLP